MAPLRKRKYESGEGATFWTRAKAMRVLQLSLKDFRRLCILKGIYPREPRSRKRAQRGETGIKTLYHKKDIQFLLHEPIIWKFREAKVHGRKIGRAKAMKDFKEMKKLLRDRPNMKLDHIIKERYPTFIDALRDLDDCLTLVSLFSTFPSLNHVPRDQSGMCRRLSLEFMHAVIEMRALRKVFISIKGYYFQAEIKGVTITWIIPHHFSFAPQTKEDVDFRIMSTFVQLYTVLLGFVNFRLFHDLNLVYPPSFSSKQMDPNEAVLVDRAVFDSERVAALNIPLRSAKIERANEEDTIPIDTFDTAGDTKEAEELRKQAERTERLKKLFEGLKIFLSREVPREPLTFALRCFGAAVSWDKILFLGASFDESDETITHQIVDRPSLPNNQYISRYYVQPQWVIDSINACELLPVEKYFIGVPLPPHLSPFTDSSRVRYEPPEETGIELPELAGKETAEEENSNDEEDNIEDVDEDEEETVESDSSDEAAEEEDKNEEVLKKKKEMKKKMTVKKGEIAKEDPAVNRQQQYQELKLREKMVERKHRALYKSMMKGRRDRNYDIKMLKKKRLALEMKKKEATA